MIYLDKPPPIVGGGITERSRVGEGETSPKTGSTTAYALRIRVCYDARVPNWFGAFYGKNNKIIY